MMVSVLHKELEYKVKKLKYKKLKVMQSRIKNKCKLPEGPFLERGISFRTNSRTGYKKLAHF